MSQRRDDELNLGCLDLRCPKKHTGVIGYLNLNHLPQNKTAVSFLYDS